MSTVEEPFLSTSLLPDPSPPHQPQDWIRYNTIQDNLEILANQSMHGMFTNYFKDEVHYKCYLMPSNSQEEQCCWFSFMCVKMF